MVPFIHTELEVDTATLSLPVSIACGLRPPWAPLLLGYRIDIIREFWGTTRQWFSLKDKASVGLIPSSKHIRSIYGILQSALPVPSLRSECCPFFLELLKYFRTPCLLASFSHISSSFHSQWKSHTVITTNVQTEMWLNVLDNTVSESLVEVLFSMSTMNLHRKLL